MAKKKGLVDRLLHPDKIEDEQAEIEKNPDQKEIKETSEVNTFNSHIKFDKFKGQGAH